MGVKHTIPTGLDRNLSKRVIDHAMEAYQAQFASYRPRFRWTSDSKGEFGFEVKGFSLGGVIEVRDHAIDVEMEVPLLFRPLKGKAIQVIEQEVNVWVEKAKRGEFI
ncbi:MAG: polyhydroxyalkanoic acid system family protein [Sandaracinaceae bacterium]|nr:polyhydroxyalkanoic acid system family protein [Sandaracinaceae bacterium]MDW8246792.1 polyhydroxyalkanoic acid system family protein [Sandaracinaceae bacterium]